MGEAGSPGCWAGTQTSRRGVIDSGLVRAESSSFWGEEGFPSPERIPPKSNPSPHLCQVGHEPNSAAARATVHDHRLPSLVGGSSVVKKAAGSYICTYILSHSKEQIDGPLGMILYDSRQIPYSCNRSVACLFVRNHHANRNPSPK